MIGIYLIQNKITRESYIGQSVNIERRWLQHKESMKNKKYSLYSDMRFYGIEQFEFKVLELCLKHELNFKENYWIKNYQEQGYYLYNILGVPEKEANYVSRKRYKRPVKKNR